MCKQTEVIDCTIQIQCKFRIVHSIPLLSYTWGLTYIYRKQGFQTTVVKVEWLIKQHSESNINKYKMNLPYLSLYIYTIFHKCRFRKM